MKVVQLETTPEVRGLEHRGGTFHARTIVEGKPGTPGNFKFSLSRLGTDYSGPRHRHNFDQYRYMIEGWSDYGQDGPLKAGMLGYYPEGVHYGPQVNKTEIYCAVLQFGGASGSGYLLPREAKAGMEELKQFGEFKDGVFHRREGFPGKRNMDAFQAIWEHVHGREMHYPKGRYAAPISLDSAHFDWVPVAGAPGVCEKLMGIFTERGCEARFLRLAPPARMPAPGRKLYFVLTGNGRVGGEPYRRMTTVFCERSDETAFEAETPTEILVLGLPRLDTPAHYAIAAE